MNRTSVSKTSPLWADVLTVELINTGDETYSIVLKDKKGRIIDPTDSPPPIVERFVDTSINHFINNTFPELWH